MFEATVRDRSYELVLQEEIAETSRMDTDIAALLVAGCVASCEAALSCGCVAVGGHLRWLNLLVGVVDEVLLMRHDDWKLVVVVR